MTLTCIGLFMLSTLGSYSSSFDVVFRLLALGVGMGIFSAPNTSAVMGSVEKGKHQSLEESRLAFFGRRDPL